MAGKMCEACRDDLVKEVLTSPSDRAFLFNWTLRHLVQKQRCHRPYNTIYLSVLY
jgi:hypothetical protein